MALVDGAAYERVCAERDTARADAEHWLGLLEVLAVEFSLLVTLADDAAEIIDGMLLEGATHSKAEHWQARYRETREQ